MKRVLCPDQVARPRDGYGIGSDRRNSGIVREGGILLGLRMVKWPDPGQQYHCECQPRLHTFSSYCLRRLRLGVANLLELVEQGFVADPEFLGGAPAVPTGTRERFHD